MGVRGEVEAYLIAFDKMWNLALEDVTETWTRPRKKKILALRKYQGERTEEVIYNMKP